MPGALFVVLASALLPQAFAMVEPPADWAPLIADGDMLFVASPIGPGLYPVTPILPRPPHAHAPSAPTDTCPRTHMRVARA
jgi:hypothetical protein